MVNFQTCFLLSASLANVARTSTCYIVQSQDDVFVKGVRGPYRDTAFPGWWMNEGGQSSTIFIIASHAAYPELKERAKQEVLLDVLEKLRHRIHNVDTYTKLTKGARFYPDFHGNRSPIADSRMRGSVVGLELDAFIADFVCKYHFDLEAIALQTRHIIDAPNEAGHVITSLYLSGGQVKNAVIMQLFADTCGIPVILPKSHFEAVVLDAAMLGRSSRDGEDTWKIMVEMAPPGTLVAPGASSAVNKLLDAKYSIFLEMIDIHKRWRRQIEEASH